MLFFYCAGLLILQEMPELATLDIIYLVQVCQRESSDLFCKLLGWGVEGA